MKRHTYETAIRGVLALVTAGLLTAGGSVAAQQEGASSTPRYGASNPPPFEVADVNGNGVIEPNEVSSVGVPFSMLDRDGSGTVSRVEYMNSTAQYAVPDGDELNPNQQASSD